MSSELLPPERLKTLEQKIAEMTSQEETLAILTSGSRTDRIDFADFQQKKGFLTTEIDLIRTSHNQLAEDEQKHQEILAELTGKLIKHISEIRRLQAKMAVNPVVARNTAIPSPDTTGSATPVAPEKPEILPKPFLMRKSVYDEAIASLEADYRSMNVHIKSYNFVHSDYKSFLANDPKTRLDRRLSLVETRMSEAMNLAESLSTRAQALHLKTTTPAALPSPTVATSSQNDALDNPLLSMMVSQLKKAGKFDEIDPDKLHDPAAIQLFMQQLSEKHSITQLSKGHRFFGNAILRADYGFKIPYDMFCREASPSGKKLLVRLSADERKIVDQVFSAQRNTPETNQPKR